MKRFGHCNHCGFCCENAIFASLPKGLDEITDDENDYLSRFDVCAVEADGRTWLLTNRPCRDYDPIGRRCTNYPKRPRICKTFPNDPNNPYLSIMDKWGVKCGYSFVEDE